MTSSSSLYHRAETAFAEGDIERALGLAEQVPPDAEEATDAAALRAECHAELGNWDKADQIADEVLREDPEWATGYLVRGLSAVASGEIAQGKTFFQQGWKADDTLGEIAFMLSIIADFEGDFVAADNWLLKAHGADHDFPKPLHIETAVLDEFLLLVVDNYDGKTLDSLEESRFRIAPMPDAKDLQEGVSLDAGYKLESLDPENDPPAFALTFFQRNLERGVRHKGELKKRLGQVLDEVLGELVEAVEKTFSPDQDNEDDR